MSEFAEKLFDARLKKKYTQAEVAKLINVTQSSYSRMEHGLQEPNLSQLKKLGEVLNISIDYLLDVNTKFFNNQLNNDIIEQLKHLYEKFISKQKTFH